MYGKIMAAACAIAVLACVDMGAAAARDTTASGAIAGMAVDPMTGRGVYGALVSVPLGLETRTATTDSSGVFFLGDMPPGTGFAVVIAREGHRAAHLTADVSPGDTSRVRAELPSVFVSLLAPTGPVQLVAGTDLSLRWESGGIVSVRIEFSPDGGVSWLCLIERTCAAAGEWRWSVPDIPTSLGVLRITAPERADLEARSAAFISITST